MKTSFNKCRDILLCYLGQYQRQEDNYNYIPKYQQLVNFKSSRTYQSE